MKRIQQATVFISILLFSLNTSVGFADSQSSAENKLHDILTQNYKPLKYWRDKKTDQLYGYYCVKNKCQWRIVPHSKPALRKQRQKPLKYWRNKKTGQLYGYYCTKKNKCQWRIVSSSKPTTQPQGQTPPRKVPRQSKQVNLSPEERKLYLLLSQYRLQHRLPTVPLSVSLTHVAQTHVRDLNAQPPKGKCNLHSWSGQGSWSRCCYTPDHAQAQCMWNKPKELSQYTGSGFEISTGSSSNKMNAQRALKSWKSSRLHNDVMINQGSWVDTTWNAVGIGIYQGYAVIWFGKENDPAGTIKITSK
jgi:uncharacterized protein YkwD